MEVPPSHGLGGVMSPAAQQVAVKEPWRGLFHEYEPGTTNPSVSSLNHVLMAFDFYRDICDEDASQMSLKNSHKLLQKCIAAENKTITAAFKAYQDFLGKISEMRQKQKLSVDRHLNRRLNDKVTDYKLRELPSQFKDERNYWHSMMSLFVLEQKQSIQRAKQEDMKKNFQHRLRVAGINTKMQFGVEAGHIIQCSRPLGTIAKYSTGDLVLLYLNDDGNMDDEATSPPANDDNDPRPYHMIGLVDSQNADGLNIEVFFQGRVRPADHDKGYLDRLKRNAKRAMRQETDSEEDDDEAVESICPEIDNMTIVDRKTVTESFLRFSSVFCEMHGKEQLYEVHCCKIMSLVTMHREFQACTSLPNIYLKDFLLLKAMKSRKRKRGVVDPTALTPGVEYLKPPTKLLDVMNTLYNESQQEALQACLKSEGITLIQGPPGTGKTTTIVGIISLILSSKPPRRTIQRALEGEMHQPDTKQRKVEVAQESHGYRSRKVSPWLYEDYKPWYDECDWTIDECEDATAYTAAHRVPMKNRVAMKQDPFVDDRPRRILVCAPSNAAIDEIVKRLVKSPEQGGGIMDENGDRYIPTLVRMGPNLHPDLEMYGLEAKIKTRLQSKSGTNERDTVRNEILSDVSIVCATLSMCGCKDMISFTEGFDTVVLDEASQGVELSTLIPMKLSCKRLIMVGDPKQLSATVFSALASHLKYDQSLFQRLEITNKLPIHMLSVQYRMHPQISAFPSRKFYNNKLTNAKAILDIAKPPTLQTSTCTIQEEDPTHNCWYSCLGPIICPLAFLSVKGEEERKDNSLINSREIDVVIQLLFLLKALFLNTKDDKKGIHWTSKIAVIAPYAAQVNEIRKRIQYEIFPESSKVCRIDVNTVDGFQGREKDVVIFSSVRSKLPEGGDPEAVVEGGSIGFLENERRMNVAVTRARYNLFVVGNREYLVNAKSESGLWNHFISYCSTDGRVIDIKDSVNAYLERRWDRMPKEKALWGELIASMKASTADNEAN